MQDEESSSTSTEEVDAESALEDIEVDLSDMTASDDAADESTQDDQAKESEEESDAESDEDVDQSEEKSDEASADESSEEVELSEEDKQKQHNREMAEKRIQAKQEREQMIKQEQEKYLADAPTDDPLEVALRQMQISQYNMEIKSNTSELTNDYQKAYNEFEILRSNDPVIQKAVDEAIDTFQATKVTMDAYGNPREVKGSLYEYLQNKADSIAQLTQIGKREQVKAKSVEKSKTFTPPSAKPKTPKVDPDLEAFDEEAYK